MAERLGITGHPSTQIVRIAFFRSGAHFRDFTSTILQGFVKNIDNGVILSFLICYTVPAAHSHDVKELNKCTEFRECFSISRHFDILVARLIIVDFGV